MKRCLCALIALAAIGFGVLAKAQDKELSVLQFNIWQEGTVIPGGFDAIADEIARLEPDFVTLSEVRNYNNTRFCDRITEALRNRGKEYYSFYSDDTGLLSKYPLTDSATVFPLNDDHGSIYRLNAKIADRDFAVYTGHLDYLNDTYYEVRGYDGNSWEKMDAPLTDVKEILRRNALSQRDEAIDSFLSDAAVQAANGAMVIFGGDFNEPSHLDWIEATRDSADHHGVVIEWTNTKRLHDAGFRDAYRVVYPNPVTHPGYTYPSANPAREPEKITWAKESDERDRIDYIFYLPVNGLAPYEAFILGPEESIAYSKVVPSSSQDKFITPLGVWATDHKGVFVKFRYR
ncbi:MAG: endonuclease/exonuclease/phosphatase family protein [Paramuribaculum sp.]|nr:endonuclease/exonuclease/phosphatase family protein [Paramuribaculum sp.]